MTTEPRRGVSTRLIAVDVARGVALLGMMAVHVFSEADADDEPSVTQLVAVGRSAALFAVLAGVALTFMTRRRRVAPGPDGRAATAMVMTRAALVGAIGVLVLGWVDAEDAVVVILPAYAVMFLLALPLLFLGTRALAVAAAVLVVVMPLVAYGLRDGLAEPSGENVSAGMFLTDPLGTLTELLLTGTYPALIWVAYLAVGLLVGRLALSSARVAAGLLGVGASLAVLAALVSATLLGPLGGAAALVEESDLDADEVEEMLRFGADGVTPTDSTWWLATAAPHTGTPLDLLATTGSALAVLGALLLLSHLKAGPARAVWQAVAAPLAAAGSMTLTLYTVHVLLTGSPWAVWDSVPFYVGQVALLLAAAVLWRRVFARGPLEELAHRLASIAARAVGPPERVPALRPEQPPPDDTPTVALPVRTVPAEGDHYDATAPIPAQRLVPPSAPGTRVTR